MSHIVVLFNYYKSLFFPFAGSEPGSVFMGYGSNFAVLITKLIEKEGFL